MIDVLYKREDLIYFSQKSNCSGFFWMASVVQYGAWRFVVISCAKMLKSRS